MIVSHRHRFIYLRTRKTASTSLEIALSRICGSDDVITTIAPRDELVRQEHGGLPPQNLEPVDGIQPYNHMPAGEIRAYVGQEVWRSYLKFTVERDPLEKVVSLYFHRYKTEPRPDLRAFVRTSEALDARNWPLYTIGGIVALDLVGNYDHLTVFVSEIEDRLVADIGPLPAAKTQFREDHRPARSILSEAEARALAEAYSPEPLPFNHRAWIDYEREPAD